jgi:hypothetical protein
VKSFKYLSVISTLALTSASISLSVGASAQSDDFFNPPDQQDQNDRTPVTEVDIEGEDREDPFQEYRTLTLDLGPASFIDLAKLSTMRPDGTVACKQKAQKVCAYSVLGGSADVFFYENTRVSSSDSFQVSTVQGYAIKLVTERESIDLKQQLVNEVADLRQVQVLATGNSVAGQIANLDLSEDENLIVQVSGALVPQQNTTAVGFGYDDFTTDNGRKVFGQRPSLESLRNQFLPGNGTNEVQEDDDDGLLSVTDDPTIIFILVTLIALLIIGGLYFYRKQRIAKSTDRSSSSEGGDEDSQNHLTLK